MITDFLGTEIKRGQKAIFYGPWGYRIATVLAVDEKRGSQSVQMRSDGYTVSGWTFPKRIIVQDNFIKPLNKTDE